MIRGARKKAAMEARELKRVLKKTSSQIAPTTSMEGQCRMASTPIAVATPLPPRKSKYTGYRWPRKAQKPQSAAMLSGMPRRRAMITGTTPLATSPTSVSAAAKVLPTRNTLVAPGLWEPSERGSAKPNSRHTRMAADMDPSR